MVFALAIVFSFLTDHLREFYGDVVHDPGVTCKDTCTNRSGFYIDEGYHWGKRHYWFWWMGAFLFLLSVANAVVGIVTVLNKNYDLDM